MLQNYQKDAPGNCKKCTLKSQPLTLFFGSFMTPCHASTLSIFWCFSVPSIYPPWSNKHSTDCALPKVFLCSTNVYIHKWKTVKMWIKLTKEGNKTVNIKLKRMFITNVQKSIYNRPTEEILQIQHFSLQQALGTIHPLCLWAYVKWRMLKSFHRNGKTEMVRRKKLFCFPSLSNLWHLRKKCWIRDLLALKYTNLYNFGNGALRGQWL